MSPPHHPRSNRKHRRRGRRPGRPKTRRRSHGSAWDRRQTDCWYYTLPGTKKRIPLLDEEGARIRGKDNKEQARLALAWAKLVEQGELPAAPTAGGEWLVARVCSEYIRYCDRGVTNRTISADHRAASTAHLNDLCKFCGALPVHQLKKTHIRTWVESHTGWKYPNRCRGIPDWSAVMTINEKSMRFLRSCPAIAQV